MGETVHQDTPHRATVPAWLLLTMMRLPRKVVNTVAE